MIKIDKAKLKIMTLKILFKVGKALLLNNVAPILRASVLRILIYLQNVYGK